MPDDVTITRNPLLSDIVPLLRAASLPFADLTQHHLRHFHSLSVGGVITGLVGTELYDHTGLLRSLVVTGEARGRGLGQTLLLAAEQYAGAQNVEMLYLLTNDADAYFKRAGYTELQRDQAPMPIQMTTQFSALCPGSAVLMYKQLRSPNHNRQPTSVHR